MSNREVSLASRQPCIQTTFPGSSSASEFFFHQIHSNFTVHLVIISTFNIIRLFYLRLNQHSSVFFIAFAMELSKIYNLLQSQYFMGNIIVILGLFLEKNIYEIAITFLRKYSTLYMECNDVLFQSGHNAITPTTIKTFSDPFTRDVLNSEAAVGHIKEKDCKSGFLRHSKHVSHIPLTMSNIYQLKDTLYHRIKKPVL